jgi:Ser/Thr protein kinase RdoA (MazF antagonist)
VHRFLVHLRARGFTLSPGFRGVTSDGREVLDYLPGVVGGYPLTRDALSPEALRGAARALRVLHDASTTFTAERTDRWMLAPRPPAEVICHGDFGPHNCVLEGTTVVGIIDFDTAHPGPRVWDVAYSIYRWAPLSTSTTANAPDLAGQAERAKIFCDEYGLEHAQRESLIDVMVARLEALVAFMRERAGAGNVTFSRHVERGDDALYESDIEYIKSNRMALDAQVISV